MIHNNDNKFDIDLKVGVQAENCLAELLSSDDKTKIEIKSEFSHWKRTGNVAIEIRCNGKPSGIAVTQAEWWGINFFDEDNVLEFSLILPVDKLKFLCEGWYKDERIKRIYGGDGNRAEMFLVPIPRLIEGLIK